MKSTPEGGNAHLFVSHRNSSSLVREFLKIRAAAGEQRTFWAHDAAAEEPAPTHPDIPVFAFDANSLSRTYDSFMGDTTRPVKPLSDVVRYYAEGIRRRLTRWIRRLLPGG